MTRNLRKFFAQLTELCLQVGNYLCFVRRVSLQQRNGIPDFFGAAKSLQQVPNPLALGSIGIDSQLAACQADIRTEGEGINAASYAGPENNAINVSTEGTENVLGGRLIRRNPRTSNQFLLADAAPLKMLLQQMNKFLVV